MAQLFLTCGLCGRKQSVGLLSRGFWGQLALGNGNVSHVCPPCKEQHSDWEDRLQATLEEA